MFFQLIFIVSSLSTLEGAECFNDGVSWANAWPQGITIHVPSAQVCLDICTKTSNCVAFTWKTRNFADHHLAESCLTYNYIPEEPENCQECISGQVADCQVCSHSVECQIGENLIAEVPTATELECKNICADMTGCGFYTWFDGSTPLKNLCFLLSSCGDTVECKGCSSGPPQCQTEYCKGIEYNNLDDPTRNENYGK